MRYFPQGIPLLAALPGGLLSTFHKEMRHKINDLSLV
jgi:hypothetical protein